MHSLDYELRWYRDYSSLWGIIAFYFGGIMTRTFEKISFKQFKNDIKGNKKLYDNYKLPTRKTTASAGYDFFAISIDLLDKSIPVN